MKAAKRSAAARVWEYADLAFAAALLAVVWWWLGALPAPMQLDFDEGIQTSKALLVVDGWRIHDEVWSDQPPMMSHLLAWWYAAGLGGDADPLVQGRRMVALFGVLGAVFAGRLVRKTLAADAEGRSVETTARWVWVGGLVAGALALVLMLGARRYARLSISVMIGVPAITTAMAAAWVAWGPRDERAVWRWARVVASAALLAVALQIKLFVFMLVPAILGLVAWRAAKAAASRGALSGTAAAGGWVAACLACSVALSATFGWMTAEQSVAPHMAEVGEQGGELVASVAANVARLGMFLLEDATLAILALVALVIAVQERRWALLAWPAGWAGVSLVSLLFADPLQSHHRLMVTIPLAMLAATGVVVLAQRIMADRAAGNGTWRVSAGVGAVALAAALVLAIGRPASLGVALGRSQGEVLDARMIEAIEAEMTDRPIGFTYMDKLTYACALGLRTPPDLAVVSAKRRRNGDFTDEHIAEAIDRWNVDLVLLERFEYKRNHPVKRIVRDDFELVMEVDGAELYRRRATD